jgi:hypothetical protein
MSSQLQFESKWAGQLFHFSLPSSHSVAALTSLLQAHFNLQNIKILGLSKGAPGPETPLCALSSLKPEAVNKLMVIGTPCSVLQQEKSLIENWESRELAEKLQREEDEHREAERERQDALERAERARIEAENRSKYEAEAAERRRLYEIEHKQRESVRIAAEIAAEQRSDAKITLNYRVIVSPEATNSGKLIFPPSALQQIIQARVEFPLTFKVEAKNKPQRWENSAGNGHMEIEKEEIKVENESKIRPNKSRGSNSHNEGQDHAFYGVLDFTASAGDSIICVPASLLSKLNIPEMAEVILTNIQLEKANFIKLESLTAEWQQLNEKERRALLEFNLRKKNYLEIGDIFTINYHIHAPEFRFRVVELQPSAICSLIDAEVNTEVTTSAESSVESSGKSDNLQHNRALELDSPIEGDLPADNYAYFSLNITDPNAIIELKAVSSNSSADLDIYCSTTDFRPGISSFSWANQAVSSSKTVILSAEQAEFRTGELFIALHAYKQPATYTLAAKLLEKLPQTGNSSEGSVNTAENSTECTNCHRFIASRALVMHETQCRRLNFYCTECKTVLKTGEKDKHRELCHSLLECLCGAQLIQAEMLQHKHNLTGNCPLRLVHCVYCPLLLTAQDRGQHQAECGLLHSNCPSCGSSIQRKLMRRHMREAHAVEESTVTWQNYW